MKILITGINGFVGKYLASHLNDKGHEVFGISLECEDNRKKNIFYGDVRDKVFVNSVVKSLKPERVYHLAAISFVPHSDIDTIYSVNFFGTLNLYEALKKLNYEVRVLFVSSSNVYGVVNLKKEELIKENFAVNPVNHYAVSKANGELLSKIYMNTGLNIVISRSFNHTGIGQDINFVVPKIVNAFRKKEHSIKLGNIDVYRDFLDVRDVVKAYFELLEKGEVCQPYNVCSGKMYSIRDIIKILCEISGHVIKVEPDAEFMRQADIPYVVGDNSRIMKATGWKPDIDFAKTLEWMSCEHYYRCQ